MATIIRLRRMGSRNKPFYRLVAADSRFATTGRFLDILGWYDPKQKADNFSVNLERVDYWLGAGAQISATAKSLVKKARAGEGVSAAPSVEKKAAVESDEQIPDPVMEAAAVETEEPAVPAEPGLTAEEPSGGTAREA